MDNRELAMALLEQATELLNEGAQADEYKAKKKEQRLKEYEDGEHRRMRQEYSKDGRSKVYHASPDRGFSSYDSNKGRSITKAEENGLDERSALKHADKMKKVAQSASEITRKEAARRNELSKKSGNGSYDRDFDDNYQMVMDATNRHLRRHGKKSQNESANLSILLTEAALLLTESVGVKDKSTDKVVKVFKDNKEATDWIIANGGNEKYRLTNELK